MEKKKVKVLTLKAPYFQAWRQYGWEEGTWGLGINTRLLKTAHKEQCYVGVKYVTTTKTYKWVAHIDKLAEFSREHHPEFWAGATKLLVFPVSIFQEI